jgi:hypothetical protein
MSVAHHLHVIPANNGKIVSRDFRQLRMHVGGLEQILTLRGGFDTLSPYVKHKVIGSVQKRSFSTND